MPLSLRTLNRTLWVRQHLVPDRPPPGGPIDDPAAMIGHLLGLQAQENLPPYLSLAARLPAFDPAVVSDGLESRSFVRILAMRGTVHLLRADDALMLRPWVQPALTRRSRSNQGSRLAGAVSDDVLDAAVAAALADGPMSPVGLGERLASALAVGRPDVPADQLRGAARDRTALVQCPPRGLWKRSGGVVHERLSTWLGRPPAEPDVADVVRRYLRAFGPASAADMTAWSGVTGLASVFRTLRDELVEYRTDEGTVLYDVPDGVIADPDLDLPPLVLGNYDNLWLSHADRRRIACDDNRRAWLGVNGGTGAAVFVDGMLEGIWRDDTSSRPGLTLLRRLTRHERAGVDDDIDRVRAVLAR